MFPKFSGCSLIQLWWRSGGEDLVTNVMDLSESEQRKRAGSKAYVEQKAGFDQENEDSTAIHCETQTILSLKLKTLFSYEGRSMLHALWSETARTSP